MPYPLMPTQGYYPSYPQQAYAPAPQAGGYYYNPAVAQAVPPMAMPISAPQNALASAPLATAPGLQVTPDQMEMMKSQLPPQLRGDFDKWFADPQVQNQLAQIQNLAMQGKLTPDMMQKMMGPGSPLANMPGQKPQDPADGLKNLLIAGLIGIPLGYAADLTANAMSNGHLDGFLRVFSKIPGLSNLDKSLSQNIESSIAKGTVAASKLARLDNNMTTAELLKETYQKMIGPKGVYTQDLKNIVKQFPSAKELLPQIQKATSKAELDGIIATLEAQSNKTVLTGELKKLFGKFIKGTGSIENTMPLAEAEHQLVQGLRQRGVGPVGRFVARFINGMQQVISGQALGQRVSGSAQKAITASPKTLVGSLGSWYNILSRPFKNFMPTLMTALLLQQAVSAWRDKNAPRENRFARTAEDFMTAAGGWLGMIAVPLVAAKTGILDATPGMTAFFNKPFLWKFSRRGFTTIILLPLLLTPVAKKLSHLLFGDPKKILEKKQAKQAQPLQTQQGLFNKLTQPTAETLPQIPGVTPNTPAFVPNAQPYEARIRISPEAIASSPFERTEKPHPRPASTNTQAAKDYIMDTIYPTHGGEGGH